MDPWKTTMKTFAIKSTFVIICAAFPKRELMGGMLGQLKLSYKCQV